MSLKKPVAVFLSDFHIGENLGGVSDKGSVSYVKLDNGVFMRKEFNTLLAQLKQNYSVNTDNKVKYLVLMGDQWDLAVQPMPYSMSLSLGFFDNAGIEDYFEEIIYIPGNHDHHLWRLYQTQQCVIEPLNRIKDKYAEKSSNAADLEVEQYPQVIPGYLDLTSSSPILTINGIGKTNSGDNFITGLTGKAGMPVNVVYPNLYIIYKNSNGEKEAALATHGHLFDPGWNIMTDYLWPFFKDKCDLKQLNLVNREMLNSPITEEWNYAITQTGKFNVVDTIYDRLLEGKYPQWMTDMIDVASVPIKTKLAALYSNAHWYKGSGDIVVEVLYKYFDDIKQYLLGYLKKEVLDGVSTTPRYDQDFIQNNQDLVELYIQTSGQYIKGKSVGCFSKLIFGHTHVPLYKWPFKFKDLPQSIDFYNTGGWVDINKTDYPLPLTIDESGYIGAIELM